MNRLKAQWQKSSSSLRELKDFLIIGVSSLMLMKLNEQYLFSFNKLTGRSMEPTFMPEDGPIVLTLKLPLFYRSARKDEVVLFKNPFNNSAYLCKRI